VDGGSTFSVLMYLSCILDAVGHPDLIRRILEYLLASPPQASFQKPKTPRHRMSLSRQKSFDLLTELAGNDDNPSPALFNLVDLISLSLRSKNKNTVASVLKLLSVILRKHHQYTLTSLFKSGAGEFKSKRTLASFDESIMNLFSIASTIDEEQLDESYEAYLQDASNLIESHPCSVPLLHFKSFSLLEADAPPSFDMKSAFNTSLLIQTDDKIFVEMLTLLEDFFTNDVMTNLSLTETIASLASCGLIQLDRWLLAESRTHSEDKERNPGELGGLHSTTKPSSTRSSPKLAPVAPASLLELSTPSPPTPLLAILEKLSTQIQHWRDAVSDFDDLLLLRKRQLRDSRPEQLPSRSVSAQSPEPPKYGESQSPTLTSFGDALAAQRTLRIQSRSSSPRGRKFWTFDSSASSEVNSTAPSISRSPIPRSAKRSPWASPLREASGVQDPTAPTHAHGEEETKPAEVFHRNFSLRLPPSSRVALRSDDAETSSIGSSGKAESADAEEETGPDKIVEISLNHVLTNVIILREFILELAAVVQARAGLFGEVG
jgi:hypothetical protein